MTIEIHVDKRTATIVAAACWTAVRHSCDPGMVHANDAKTAE